MSEWPMIYWSVLGFIPLLPCSSRTYVCKRAAWSSASAIYRCCCTSRKYAGNTFPNAGPPSAYRFYPNRGIHFCRKSSVSTLGFFLVGNDALEAFIHIIRHRNNPCTAACLGVLDDILHIPLPLQLMVNVDLPIFHIHIRQRQTHKLGNPKPGLEQNIDTIIVFAKMLVTRHKFKKRSFLLSGNRFPCHAVVDYDGGKLKFKWILAYQIIIDGHLKGWSDNPLIEWMEL